MNIRLTILTCLAAGALAAAADAPEGYYDACRGKSKSALKSQLYSIVKNHTAITYSSGTWPAFQYTDVDPTGTYWVDIYTLQQVPVDGHSGMNIEHTFPKSWWGGANNNAYKDLVHLMPVDQWANNDRSNHPFGEVRPGSEKTPHRYCEQPNYKLGAPVAGQGGGATYVFEPADEYKGDMARTYFYMVTCYQDLSWSTEGLRTAAQGVYPTLQPWAIDMLLRWHRQDPVSDKERKRNDGVYATQKNRNPFIDHPEMVEHIWGNLMESPWGDGGTVTPDPDPDPNPDPDPDYGVITAPVDGDVTTFASDSPGYEAVHLIPMLGSGFTHSLTVSISGRDAALFDIMLGSTPLKSVTVGAAEINDAEGTLLKVRYLPEESTGELHHQATLTIAGRDLAQNVSMTLDGTCAVASILMPTIEVGSDARYFSLDGRPLTAAPQSSGIYIVVSGGKAHKYIVR